MRVLILSPYPAYSHKLWVRQLIRGLPEVDWRVLELPARHFAWRLRANPLQWHLAQTLREEPVPDLLLATSMTDLATFKGVAERRLRDVPSIVYFHENQFAYPLTPGVPASVEPRMVQLYSLLAADRVVFNSRYNRDTFAAGAARFLARMPDGLPAGRIEAIAASAEVIPVPVRDVFFDQEAVEPPAPPRLIWHHRWEYDKGPERLLTAVLYLVERGLDFRLELAGQRFRETPAPLRELKQRFPGQVADHGYLDETDYPRFLAAGGHALSTAVHDFQGLAMLEAAAAGCVPAVPDRLAYPEWFDARYRYPSHDDPAADGRTLGRHLRAIFDSGGAPAPEVAGLRLEALAGRYRTLFKSVV